MNQKEAQTATEERARACPRSIGRYGDPKKGPTIVVTAGIHGNEPSGVEALVAVFASLEKERPAFNGCLIGLRGNCRALHLQKRFHTEDLNRIWTRTRIQRLREGHAPLHSDEAEMSELLQTLDRIQNEAAGPLYFFDLHTTSSQTIPFTTVNDSLINRCFAEQLGVPMILGIEEYLDGPLLSYLNELGYVSFGFEGGQHEAESAREAHQAFIQLSLFMTGVRPMEPERAAAWKRILRSSSRGVQGIFEIRERFAIKPGMRFSMQPGYENFQSVKKGQLLATADGRPVRAPGDVRIFMPLYQKQGHDGFFIIQPTARFFLRLSAFLRRKRWDRLLAALPGVSWYNKARTGMRVNKKTARFLAKQLFHLFGYRYRSEGRDYFIAYNREAKARRKEYVDAPWYKG